MKLLNRISFSAWCCAIQRRSAATVAIALLTLSLTACGGGSGAEPEVVPDIAPEPTQGELIIAITDAEGDFVSYAVDVVSLQLENANGDVVETLPFSTRIDFTELTEVTEFLSIATVPSGNYESVVITLDYTDADIIVQDQEGSAIAAAAVDADGNALGQISVNVNLDVSDTILIAPGIPASFSLDFDLDASNTIDFAMPTPTVTVEPFLLAQAELESEREHRVRGALDSLDAAASDFTLNVRPFRHRVGSFGQFTVATTNTTQFEVDGVGYTGFEGLSAMGALAANAPVVANGAISGRSMVADIVIAGSSVPWTDGSVVKGVVSARSGDTLTVRGARVEYADGVEVFRGVGSVQLGSLTTVTAPGVDNATLDTASVSVGQRIVAFGELLDDRTLDASAGRIVMQMNQLTGSVIEAEPLVLDVHLLNARRTAAFDFSGTGVDPVMDTDPARYEVDTGALTLASVETGDLLRVRGLVNSFGQAPADMAARSVIDVNTELRPGTLTVVWPEGSVMPFNSALDEGIELDLTASREVFKLRGVPRLFPNLYDSALLVPTESTGLYAVKVRGSGELHVYRSFSDLVAELNAQLDNGATLFRVTAQVRGTFDSSGWVTPRASFVFQAANGE